jgi:hypothetical protein
MVTLLGLICAQFALGNGAPVYLGLQAPARVFTELYAQPDFLHLATPRPQLYCCEFI